MRKDKLHGIGYLGRADWTGFSVECRCQREPAGPDNIKPFGNVMPDVGKRVGQGRRRAATGSWRGGSERSGVLPLERQVLRGLEGGRAFSRRWGCTDLVSPGAKACRGRAGARPERPLRGGQGAGAPSRARPTGPGRVGPRDVSRPGTGLVGAGDRRSSAVGAAAAAVARPRMPPVSAGGLEEAARKAGARGRLEVKRPGRCAER